MQYLQVTSDQTIYVPNSKVLSIDTRKRNKKNLQI